MDFELLADMGLPKKLFDNKIISAREINLNSNTVVFQSGDPCGAFLILVEGKLRVDMTSKSGKEITLYKMEKKESCIITTSVLLNYENYYANAITETAVTAIAIPVNDFHHALNHYSQFTRYVLSSYSKRMATLIRLIDKISSKDILYELSDLLLKNADTQNFVSMKQEDIAKAIGTAREVVSRKLAVLEEAGAVSTHRGKVEIINRNHLEKIIST